MSDLNHHDEEEYHFDDSENFDFGEHDSTAEDEFVGDEEIIEAPEKKEWDNTRSAAAPDRKFDMKKKIATGVGVVVLLVVGYYLMTPRGGANAPKTSIPAATANKPPVVPVAKMPSAATNTATTPAEPTAATPPLQATQTAAPSVTNSDANNVAEDDAWLTGSNNNAASVPSSNVSATTGATAAGQPQVANDDSLQMQLQTLNVQNQTLSLKLQQVTAQSEEASAREMNLEKTVAQLQAQMAQMNKMLQGTAGAQGSPEPLTRTPATAVRSDAATTTAATPGKASVTYFVQAIIPGRAWIADSNGRIVTVTQGDRFEALNSTVKDIDPINGIVTLNNGRQIEYGMVAQ